MNQIEIVKYRNLTNFQVSGLSKVNLFVGKNNIGKSNLLKAINIANVKDIGTLSGSEYIDIITPENHVHFNPDEDGLEFEYDNTVYEYKKESPIVTLSDLWGNIVFKNKYEKFLIKGLQIIEPNITKFVYKGFGSNKVYPVVKMEDGTQLQVDQMGSGINTILSIVLNMVNSENGVFTIDDFGQNLYHSLHYKFWQLLISIATELNIQLFVTTHSMDAIVAYHKALMSEGVDGMLYRMEIHNSSLFIVDYDKFSIETLIIDKYEMR